MITVKKRLWQSDNITAERVQDITNVWNSEQNKRMRDDKAKSKEFKHKVNAAEPRAEGNNSKYESAGLFVQHALASSVGKDTWIIDSGAKTHMHNENLLWSKNSYAQ